MNDIHKYKPLPVMISWIFSILFKDKHGVKLGDIEELYNEVLREKGKVYAVIWSGAYLLRSINPMIENAILRGYGMFKNYSKIAIRNMLRSKIYTAINVFGLAVGIGFSILVYFFIKSELSYDQFHSEHENIYRVLTAVNPQGSIVYFDRTPYPLANTALDEIPGIEETARFINVRKQVLRIGTDLFEEAVRLADSGFWNIFNFPLVLGNHQNVLSDQQSMVISERIRDKYFANENPIGTTVSIMLLNLGTFEEFVIAGVARIPDNSSIQFDFLVSDKKLEKLWGASQLFSLWESWIPINTFIKLQNTTEIESVERNLSLIADREGMSKKNKTEHLAKKFPLQQLRDIHFDRITTINNLEPPGSMTYSWILGGIALTVLIVACINFVNLSIGLSTKRIREVGVRKVFGARRSQLMKQFWFESLVISFVALLFGILFAELALPLFNNIADKAIVLEYFRDVSSIFVLLGLGIFVGMTSGFYPALILSDFTPAKIFKGSLRFGGKQYFTRLLLTVQFSVTIFLIIGTITMFRQMDFIANKDLGYNDELVIVQYVPFGWSINEQDFETYRREIINDPHTISVAGSDDLTVTDTHYGYFGMRDKNRRSLWVYNKKVTHDYLKVMGIKVIMGRDFSRDQPSDRAEAVIVNEKFLEAFAVENPLGHDALQLGRQIIGVIEDFHFESLKEEVKPVMITLDRFMGIEKGIQEILIKVRSDNLQETLAFYKEKWESAVPNTIFNYTFLDEQVEQMYRTDENWKKIISYSAYLAITIGCLGLFGMTSLSVVKRSKEMGIRKVLGASITGILGLFNREYVYLIILSNVIAWPVAFYVMNRWLENFVYRIALEYSIFLFSGVIVLAVAVVTISIQALKSGFTNPVDTLRYE